MICAGERFRMVKEILETTRSDPWIRLALVIALINLTNGLNIALYNPQRGNPSFILYWLDVGLLSLLLGAIAGILAAILAVLSVWFLLIPPLFSFSLATQRDVETLYLFSAVALLAYAIGYTANRFMVRPAR
jgi:K+-sensing histidine kinase KdpD